jgi:hypothetical protein
MNEPGTSRNIIRLINKLDTDERPAEVGQELIATVKGAPQFVTEAVAEVLLETAASGLSEHVLEAVRAAAEADRISRNAALDAAAAALSDDPLEEAAKILLSFRTGVTPELLVPARRWLIMMVGRNFGPIFDYGGGLAAERRRALWHAAFNLLVEVDLAGALSTIEQMLTSDREYDRERGAAAIEVLIDTHPDIAPVVAHQLVAGLAKSDGGDPWGLEERADDAVIAALARCLWHRPRETAQAMEAGAAALDDHLRHELFHAYDSVIRRAQLGERVPDDVGAVVVEMCLKHASGDWGDETQRAAYDLLELTAKWQGHLLDEHPEALLSLLLDAISKKPSQTPPPERANDPMWFLENMSSSMTRNARIRDIRGALGGVASRRPRDVLDIIESFLDEDALQTDEAIEMRAECTRLLGFVAKRSDYLSEVLPLLYRGLVHREPLVRAWAIYGLLEVSAAHPADTIPIEFSATIPALLTDSYVIVHKTTLHALTRGVPVRDEHFGPVVTALLGLADYYAKSESDSDALDDALRGIQILAHRQENATVEVALERIVARLARKLDAYDLKYFVERGRRSLLEMPEYVAAVVDVLQRPEIVHEPNRGDSDLREILFHVPPALLVTHVADLRAAAMEHLPLRLQGAVEYVEVLQRIGLWDDAVKLADDVVAAIPTTIDNAPRRTYAERVRAWALVEAAIAAAETDVSTLIQQAVDATTAHDGATEAAQTEMPWPD